jgi:multidrug efflux pump subunit AcrA (membrane-fusion protein)
MAKPIRDRWFLALASLVMLALVGGGVYAWKRRAAPSTPVKPVAEEAAPAAGAEVSFTGVIQAQVVAPVAAPIDGTLETVEVEVGSEVFEGQLIARIKNLGLETEQAEAQQEVERVQTRINNLESTLIAARLEASRAGADAERARLEYEKAEKAATRQQLLYNEKATPRLTYEKAQRDLAQAKTEYDAAREQARQAEERVAGTLRELDAAKRMLEEKTASLEAARADMAVSEVHAPVDGLLVAAAAKVGDEVEPGMKDLFQIAVDPSKLQVLLEPEAAVAAKLAEGLPAIVQVLELSSDAIAGEVKKTESGQWKVEFTTGDSNIKPGLNAIVKVKLP